MTEPKTHKPHRYEPNDPTGLSVLLVDDDPLNLAILESSLQSLQMRVLKAQSGEEAVEVFRREKPDMVLMDVVMPGMGGIEATRQIKQIRSDYWTPVLIVTSLYSNEDIVAGLEVGADDYLVKPVNHQILMFKVANMAHAIRQQQALRRYRENAEAESELAMEVMDRLIGRVDFGEALRHWSMPTAGFNGDMMVAGTAPDGRMQAILADGTGHGLAAALSVMPVVEVFYGMNRKGLAVEGIVRELNSKLRKIMPVGRFVAAITISVDLSAGEIRAWNGGIPYAVFMSKDGKVLHEWRSKHLPLGVLEDVHFEEVAEVFQCSHEGFFFACTDGLLEAQDAAGIPIGEERLLKWLKADVPDMTGHIAGQLSLCLGTPAHDDISFLIIPYRPI